MLLPLLYNLFYNLCCLSLSAKSRDKKETYKNCVPFCFGDLKFKFINLHNVFINLIFWCENKLIYSSKKTKVLWTLWRCYHDSSSKYFFFLSKFNKMKIFWQKSNNRNGVSLLSLPSTEHHCWSAKDCRGN